MPGYPNYNQSPEKNLMKRSSSDTDTNKESKKRKLDVLASTQKLQNDMGVSHVHDNSIIEVTGKLSQDQVRKTQEDIEIRNKILTNKLKATKDQSIDNYLHDKNIDPKAFKETREKLQELIENYLKDQDVSATDFKIAHEKFDRMLKKLGIHTKS